MRRVTCGKEVCVPPAPFFLATEAVSAAPPSGSDLTDSLDDVSSSEDWEAGVADAAAAAVEPPGGRTLGRGRNTK